MKNTINTMVVCSKDDLNRLKEELNKVTTEVNIKYYAESYKEAIEIINDERNNIDAIIVDGDLKSGNILSFLTEYNNLNQF